ncbi:hypothetical protein BO78DRAFT_16047 [Aspergillus sclerotiicarbonarius CBS 121057]|uniref:CBM-cenC domain-containing protein n=1 Tax=Aspergillus sclerotiicarbonarius (strain CBS 121057 / IBT 28362) TaxID=1448318 RepID=A0A319DZF1_ASPSB|nr:hypothetical protein BO78DRAFT_16047 [Aspergillus sclerotiicarbonarius CBS 121057]
MTVSPSFLPLAWLVSHGIGAVVRAADIEVCTQVTRDFVENGDFTDTSAWTSTSSSDEYSIVTSGGFNDGGMLEIPYSTSANGFEFEQTIAVQEGPYYQLHSYWNMFGDPDENGAYPYCSMDVYAVTDETTEFVTYGDIWSPDGSATSWDLVLGQWQSQVSEVALKFRVTCSQASSSTLQISGISLLGPEVVCTSQCAASTTTLSGELVQDGSFTDDDSTVWLDMEHSTNLDLVDDDAPGGGQCVYIPGSDYDFYQLNQTVADAQVGQRYNASVSWRLKSGEYDADVSASCSIDYRLSDDDTGLLLDILHEGVTVLSADSGWMTVNGTWDATVSDFTIMISVQCSTDDTDYLPDIEIANVQLNIQTVSCPVRTSSSAMASSTPVSSVIPSRTPISSAAISSTLVSSLTVPSSSSPASSPALASSVAVSRSRVASSSLIHPISSVSPSAVVSRSRVAASPSSLVSSSAVTPVTIPVFVPGSSSAVVLPVSSSSAIPGSSHILTPGQPGKPRTSIFAPSPLPTTTGSDSLTGPAGSEMTTSTVFTTSTATITACPSTVTDCPASKKKTYLTTETILVSTTVCPITAVATATTPR